MKKRPLCLACIGLMTLIFLMKLAGVPLWGKPAGRSEIRSAVRTGETVHVTGQIQGREKTANAVRYYLNPSFLIVQNRQIPLHKIYIITQTDRIYPVGGILEVSGALEQPEEPGNPGQFHAREYYACQGIYYCMWGESLKLLKEPEHWLKEHMARLREKLTARTAELVPEKPAGILAAMLWGDRSLLEEESSLNFKFGSLYHILSISGSHISCLGMAVFRLTRRVFPGKVIPIAAAAACMGWYCLFTGAQAATVRAYIMFAAGLGARLLGRSYDMLCALALSGILILLEQPGYLFYSGFQLSFTAVLGIGLVSPAMLRLLPERKKTGSVFCRYRRKALESLVSCGAVWLTALPLSAFWFYEIPLWGVWMNLLLLPVMGPVMMLGLAGCVLGLFLPALGKTVLFLPALLLTGSEKLMEPLRFLPGGLWICGQPEIWQIGAVCAGLALLVFWLGRERKKIEKGRRLAAAGSLLLLWILLFARAAPEFSITALDVGQGDCLVLQTGEACFLVDGGSSSENRVGQYRILPYLKQQGISRIEGIFITHPDQDHINGMLELLKAVGERQVQLSINCLLLPEWMRGKESEGELARAAGKAGIPIRYLKAGDRVRSGECAMEILWPEAGAEPAEGEENSASLVLKVRWKDFDALLTGDLEGEGEQELLRRLGPCEYLKVAHHGSGNSTGKEFLDAVRPEICVISVPEHSVYGHPHPEVLERIREAGGKIFTTGKQGAVRVTAENGRIRVRVFRGVKQNNF